MFVPAGEALAPLYVIEKRASTLPSSEGKKTCIDLAACSSLRFVGSLGSDTDVPAAVEVNVPRLRSTTSELNTSLPEAARSGVL